MQAHAVEMPSNMQVKRWSSYYQQMLQRWFQASATM